MTNNQLQQLTADQIGLVSGGFNAFDYINPLKDALGAVSSASSTLIGGLTGAMGEELEAAGGDLNVIIQSLPLPI